MAGKIQKFVRGKDRTVGVKCLAEVKKNRVTGKIGKDRSVQIPIYYDFGIDDVGSCVDYLVAEQHWPKKDKIINAKDLLCEGSRGKIIAHIEEEGLEEKVRQLTAKVWSEVEAECEPNRKKRYE